MLSAEECRHEWRQVLQPKVGRFAEWVAKLIRLYDGRRLWQSDDGKRSGVLDGDILALGIVHLEEKRLGFHCQFQTFLRQLPRFRVHPSCASLRHVGARWVSHKQLPLALLSVSLSVLRRKFAVAIQQRQAIAHDVPFRMTAAAFLQVGREGSVSECSECLANRLAFLAGYQYVQSSFVLIGE